MLSRLYIYESQAVVVSFDGQFALRQQLPPNTVDKANAFFTECICLDKAGSSIQDHVRRSLEAILRPMSQACAAGRVDTVRIMCAHKVGIRLANTGTQGPVMLILRQRSHCTRDILEAKHDIVKMLY